MSRYNSFPLFADSVEFLMYVCMSQECHFTCSSLFDYLDLVNFDFWKHIIPAPRPPLPPWTKTIHYSSDDQWFSETFLCFHLSWSLMYKNTLFLLKLKYVRKNPSEASNGQTSQIAAKIEVDSWEIGQTTLLKRNKSNIVVSYEAINFELGLICVRTKRLTIKLCPIPSEGLIWHSLIIITRLSFKRMRIEKEH